MYVKERQIIFLDMSSIGAWSRIGNAAMSGPGFSLLFLFVTFYSYFCGVYLEMGLYIV